jgi:hypothetical protein
MAASGYQLVDLSHPAGTDHFVSQMLLVAGVVEAYRKLVHLARRTKVSAENINGIETAVIEHIAAFPSKASALQSKIAKTARSQLLSAYENAWEFRITGH